MENLTLKGLPSSMPHKWTRPPLVSQSEDGLVYLLAPEHCLAWRNDGPRMKRNGCFQLCFDGAHIQRQTCLLLSNPISRLGAVYCCRISTTVLSSLANPHTISPSILQISQFSLPADPQTNITLLPPAPSLSCSILLELQIEKRENYLTQECCIKYQEYATTSLQHFNVI